jgi:hypothetical protein
MITELQAMVSRLTEDRERTMDDCKSRLNAQSTQYEAMIVSIKQNAEQVNRFLCLICIYIT